ncbi:MAG: site-specific integrase [Caldilinea sp.]|uniref:tyrosine-type recombinase/integrase n=1 Tax=Caldilinea sp. TaxID=2293560 RepID=UPI002BA960E5|nr:site-specific integrase [Anaerolineales bacterium]HQY93351.1 site-specific integrase [Caldilinea sp.]HRA68351.1 site-specific integrase [Caldilinea sp.]
MSELPVSSHDEPEVDLPQETLIPDREGATVEPPPDLTPPLRANSSVVEAVNAFHEYMVRKGFSENTIKAFQNDLKFLTDYLGRETRLYHVSTQNLDEFLPWLAETRGMEFSAKTQARRITTMKVFFGWLHGVGVISTDPAEPLVQIQARTPLATILRDSDVRTLLLKAQDISRDRQNPDARPYLLVSLLVQTGIKKAECARLLIDDIDIAQPSSPVLMVRYREERYAHKNRSLGLTATIVPALQQYLAQYNPQDLLFDCTPRNLEYVLEDLGELAGIRYVQVGFEALRWTCAVRDFRNGMPEEQLRQKMGLSKISWRETSEKVRLLAGR